jgi:hypothetical protein
MLRTLGKIRTRALGFGGRVPKRLLPGELCSTGSSTRLAVVVLPEPIIPSVKIGRAALTGQGHAAPGAQPLRRPTRYARWQPRATKAQELRIADLGRWLQPAVMTQRDNRSAS